MSKAAKTTAICNQKGDVGKTVTAVNLGIGLAREGKRVLLVDADPQGSLTASLGYQHPDQLEGTLAAETSAEGRSIYLHDPAGKVSAAYAALTREVLT